VSEAAAGSFGSGGARRSQPARIVLAMILAADETLASIAAESAADPATDREWQDPAGLAAAPLRFSEHAGPWGVAATVGTGAPPLRHGVLTMLAIDESTLSPRARRASDADRPWIWERLAAHGHAATVVGWPGIQDANGSALPLATLAAAMTPRRLAALAADRPLQSVPRAWQGAAPQEILSQLLSPREAAADLARATLAAAESSPGDRPEQAAARRVAMLLAAAHSLDATATGDPGRTRLWAIGVTLRPEQDRGPDGAGAADGVDPADEIVRSRTILAATLARLAEAAGAGGVLLAAVIGERSGRLWHSTAASPPVATAIDLAPTILQLAGVPVSADLPGESLLGKIEETAKSWDVARWALPEPESPSAARRPPAASLARQALAGRERREGPVEPASLEGLLLRHFESEWALALSQPDWQVAHAAAQSLIDLRGSEIDLWRSAFSAFQGDLRHSGEAAAARLRELHPESLSTRLLGLLSADAPSTPFLQSLDLAEVRIPTQRSIIGRAAAQAGLDELCRKSLAPIVAAGLAIPADRIALARTLLRLGDGKRALAALGGIGLGAESPGRLRILRAECLAKAGLRDRAIQLLERHVALTPFDGEARTALAKLRVERDSPR
jgi:hypothetical protein